WAYDAVIRSISEELTQTDDQRARANWFDEQTCEVHGPWLGFVDLRELTPRNQQLLRQAAQLAFRKELRAGPDGWFDPAFFPGWIGNFRRFLRMWKAIDRGEPMGLLDDATQPMDPTHRRLGPGWDRLDGES